MKLILRPVVYGSIEQCFPGMCAWFRMACYPINYWLFQMMELKFDELLNPMTAFIKPEVRASTNAGEQIIPVSLSALWWARKMKFHCPVRVRRTGLLIWWRKCRSHWKVRRPEKEKGRGKSIDRSTVHPRIWVRSSGIACYCSNFLQHPRGGWPVCEKTIIDGSIRFYY